MLAGKGHMISVIVAQHVFCVLDDVVVDDCDMTRDTYILRTYC